MTLKHYTTSNQNKNDYGEERRQEKISVKGSPERKPHFRKQWVGKIEMLKEELKTSELPKEIKKKILEDAKKNYLNKK